MPDDVWAARDTQPAKVEAALLHLLAERHRKNAAFVPSRVVNLVVIVDADYRGEVENRLERVGQYHPSRLILCAVHRGQRALDAVATLHSAGDGEPHPGQIAVLREKIELEIGDGHLASLDTIVDPLIVADVATMVWSPHGFPAGVDALARLAQIMLIDSLDEPDVEDALDRAAQLAEGHHVVDLAWLRSTPWRERVAAAFDPPQWRVRLGQVSAVEVRHREDSGASAALFVGWLASRLGWKVDRLGHKGAARSGRVSSRRQDILVTLAPVRQDAPGLAGVTIDTAAGECFMLDRAPGGLVTTRRDRRGRETSFRLLGASRGEGGILGEGVRQALLRDRLYAPALTAARGLVGRAV